MALRPGGEIGLAIVGAAALALFWGAAFREPVAHLSLDLYPTWVAAQLHAAGIDEAVYHPALWIAGHEHPAWAAVLAKNHIPGGNGTSYTYGPAYLIALTPLLSRISLEQTSALFFGINAISVGILGVEIARLARVRSALGILALILGLGASFPVLTAVWLGQNTLPCLAALLLGERAFGREDRAGWIGGGLLWMAAFAMKPWAILALPILAVARRWRALAAGGCGVAGVALPGLLSGSALRDGYAAVSAHLLAITVIPRNNVSIRVHLMRLLWPDWPKLALNWQPLEVPGWARISEAAFCAGVALLGVVWVLRRRPAPVWVLATGLFAILLPLGVCWTHYLAFALPLAGVAALHPESPRAVRIAGIGVALYLLLAMPTPLHLLFRADPSTDAYLSATLDHPLASAWILEIPMLVCLGLAAVVVACVRADAHERR